MSPRSSDRSTFSAVVSGVLVGVLVFALGLGTLYAVRHTDWNGSGDGSSATPSPSGKPRLQPLPAGPMPATDPKLKKFYDQRLSWQDCGANECSTLTVPLDYAHPDGQTIGIHVLRVPARGKFRTCLRQLGARRQPGDTGDVKMLALPQLQRHPQLAGLRETEIR